MGLSWADLLASVVTNGVIMLIVFIVFLVLRRMTSLWDFWHAKRNLSIPFRCDPDRAYATVVPSHGYVEQDVTCFDHGYAQARLAKLLAAPSG
jgi:hypothetical protein